VNRASQLVNSLSNVGFLVRMFSSNFHMIHGSRTNGCGLRP
jgi:hypothetical protein